MGSFPKRARPLAPNVASPPASMSPARSHLSLSRGFYILICIPSSKSIAWWKLAERPVGDADTTAHSARLTMPPLTRHYLSAASVVGPSVSRRPSLERWIMESPEAIQAELARRLVLGEVIARNARKFPDKEAVIYGDTRLTYRQFNARINRLAHALMDIGSQEGRARGHPLVQLQPVPGELLRAGQDGRCGCAPELPPPYGGTEVHHQQLRFCGHRSLVRPLSRPCAISRPICPRCGSTSR